MHYSLAWVSCCCVLALVTSGCGSPSDPGDAGGGDAGRDAGSDSGRADGGSSDAAPSDAAMVDSAIGDGGVDAGSDSGIACGNGIAEGDEECDDGAANSDVTPDACRLDCTKAQCGDGVIDSEEACEGDLLDGRTCETEGFESGDLACASDCSLDASGCVGEPTWAVTFCRLQFPTTIDATTGVTTTVYGRVYAAGLTDRSSSNDLSPNLVAELGFGPDGTDPATDATWSWQSAEPNPGWTGAEVNNDEYQAGLVTPAEGTYDFAFRFSGDGGATWVHCDGGDPGSSDGYQTSNAGSLVAHAAPSCPLVINEVQVEGATTSDPNDEFVEIYNPCSVAVDLLGYSLVFRNTTAVTDTELFTVATSHAIGAGEYRVFGGSAYTGTTDFGGWFSGMSRVGGGIALRAPGGTIVDSMGYGTATTSHAFVNGSAAPIAVSGPSGRQSMARTPNGSDTNVDEIDFVVGSPSPRAPNP